MWCMKFKLPPSSDINFIPWSSGHIDGGDMLHWAVAKVWSNRRKVWLAGPMLVAEHCAGIAVPILHVDIVFNLF